MYIDGNIVNSNITRISRNDVDIAVSTQYGGVSNTPNAGFVGIVDVSNLNKGKHIIKVQELSRYGDVICEISSDINIENKKYSGEMWVDTPAINKSFNYGSVMSISGWAVSDDENSVMQVGIIGEM